MLLIHLSILPTSHLCHYILLQGDVVSDFKEVKERRQKAKEEDATELESLSGE